MTVKITKEAKTQVLTENRRHDGDTGSPEVQVALITQRIRHLTGHLKTHMKDHASRRGLLMLVGKRTKLLKYLRNVDAARYNALIERLELRK
ncbi:MAG TPA: 30S ribosomal protein S15 [Planctomycetota bacterium]|nr:30S ribosomal protein S15 [Planctomycetota bacterium]